MKTFAQYLCITLFLLQTMEADVQDEKSPFKKLYDNHGLIVSFLFYSDGDGMENNGVVIYLENKKDYDISFQFTLIFRALNVDRERQVTRTLKANEKRTGSDWGLYFIPFEDGRSLSEVGIKNCKVRRI